MTTIITTPQGFGRTFADLEQKRVEALKAATVEAAEIGVRIVRSHLPKDQGELVKTTHLEVHELPPGASGVLAAIVEDAPYAVPQEVGTRPFRPPLGPLRAWAWRQAPNLGLDRTDDRAIWAFAKAVQNTIGVQGIRAKFSTRAAQPKLGRVLLAKLRQAMQTWAGSLGNAA